MGTSSSYDGPVGPSPLLPPWAPPPPEEPDDKPPENGDDEGEGRPGDQDQPDGDDAPDGGGIVPPHLRPSWSTAKTAMREFAKSGGDETRHLRRAGRRFVQAQGGARSAARAARSGTATAMRLGGALAAAAQAGAAGLAQFLARQFVGGDADALLAELVDAIAPDGAMNEDAAARAAAAETLERLFEHYAVAAEGLDALTALTEEAVVEVLGKYVETYVYVRLMQVLAKRIEQGATSAQSACDIEWQVRGYIAELVDIELGGRDSLAMDWSSRGATQMVEGIFADAYELLETWE